MKKFLFGMFFTVLMLVTCVVQSAAQNTVTVNNGTETNQAVPADLYQCDAFYHHTQFLIPASDLTSVTNMALTSMQFYLSSAAGKSFVNNWVITLKETTSTSLSAYEDVSTGTVVYTGTVDWNTTTPTIEFDNDFIYSSGNILVDFHYQNSKSTYANSKLFSGVSMTGGSVKAYGNSDPTSPSVLNFSPKVTFTYTVPPTCFPPTGLAVSNITATTADFSWSPSAEEESAWEYVCVPSTDTANWANATNVTWTSEPVTGLQPNTNYTFYVRSYCSATDKSKSVKISFKTACAAVDPISLGTIGFEASEGFTATGSTNPIGNCWSEGNIQAPASSSNIPYVKEDTYTAYARTGSQSLYFYAQNSNSSFNQKNKAYAIMPDMNYGARGIQGYNLEFWFRKSSSGSNYWDTLYIGVTNDITDTIVYVGYAVNTTNSYVKAIVSFADYTGPDGNIVFMAKLPETVSTSIYASFYVDDIRMRVAKNCPTPSDIDTSNVTSTSADINWTATANSYRILATTTPGVDPDIFTAWTIDTTVTSLPATLSLTPGSRYYVFGQNICSTDSSDISYTCATVETQCEIISSFPWTEKFENGVAETFFDAPCWGNVNPGGSTDYLAKYDDTTIGGNSTKKLRFPDCNGQTMLVTLPQFNIPTAGTHQFELSIYRTGQYLNKPLEGVKVITENAVGGYDTVFVPRVDTVTGGVGRATNGDGWYTYVFPLTKAGLNTIQLLDYQQWGKPTYLDNLRVRKTPTCFAPDTVDLRDNQPTQVVVEWIATTAPTHQVLLTTEQIDPEDLANIPADKILFNDTTSADSAVISGLTPATMYYVYVRGLCTDEISDWTTHLAFRTACQTVTITKADPYFNSFENDVDNSREVICWEYNTTSTGQWPAVYNLSSYARTGSKMLSFGGYAGTNDTSYYAMVETTNPVNTLRVKFWMKGTASAASENDSIIVGVMSDITDTESFVPVAGFQAPDNSNYYEYETDFSQYTGPEGRIAIKRIPMPGVGYMPGSTYYYGSYIEDVTIDLAPTCKKVTDVAARDIKKTTATLTWHNTGAARYHVTVADAHVNPLNLDSAALTHVIYADTVATDTLALTGLNKFTNYYAYVMGDCGGGDSAEISKEYIFTTCDVLPYSQDFQGSYAELSEYIAATNVDSVIAGVEAAHRYDGFYKWQYNTFLGNDTATMKINIYGPDNFVNMLATQTFLFDGAVNPTLSFDVCRRDYATPDSADDAENYDDRFYVLIANPEMTQFVKLATWGNDTLGLCDYSLRDSIGHYFTHYDFELPITEGAYRIVFTGGSIEQDNDYDLHIDNIVITDPAEVVAIANDPTRGSVEGSGTYCVGQEIQLVAVANEDYHLYNWSNGETADTIMYTIVSSNDTVVANFVPDSVTITATSLDMTMGTVTGSGNYYYGDTAVITAVPNAYHHFVAWSDNDSNAVRSIVATENVNITALFAIDSYNVTLNVNDTVAGSLVGDPSGSYTHGSVIAVAAIANPDYHFVNWSNGLTNDTITIEVISDTTLTAIFARNNVTITLSVNDSVMGTVTGAGVYAYADTVTITAAPNTGYHFVAWSDNDSNAVRTFVATDNVTLTAEFAVNNYNVVINVNDTAAGYLEGAASGVYPYDSVLVVVAVANEGYHFTGWSNGVTTDTLTFNVASDTTITAYFAIDKQDTVTINVVGAGEVSGGGFYNDKETVTLVATPHDGWMFTGWTISDTSAVIVLDSVLTDSVLNFTILGNVTVTAEFQVIPTSVDDVESASYVAYVAGRQIVVNGVENRTVGVYDAAGRLVTSVAEASSEVTINVNAAGVYFVRVSGMKSTSIVVK